MSKEDEYVNIPDEEWEAVVVQARAEADELAEKLCQKLPPERQENQAVRNLALFIAISKLRDTYGQLLVGDVYYELNATQGGQFVEGYLKEVYKGDMLGGDYLGFALGPEKDAPFMYVKSETTLGRTLLASPLQSTLLPVTVNVILNRPCLKVRDDLLQMPPPVNKSLA